MSNKPNNLGEYINALTDAQGVSVVTAEDGWVFTFTKDKLRSLLETAADHDKVMIFIKTSANGPIN